MRERDLKYEEIYRDSKKRKNVKIKGLKKERESLKGEMNMLRREFEEKYRSLNMQHQINNNEI